MRVFALLLAPVAAMLLSGCLARTALDIATTPVRIASKAVDLATTSQSEADETRGREIRRREEQLGRLQSAYAELEQDCLQGQDRACRQAVLVRGEIEALLPSLPVEPVRD